MPLTTQAHTPHTLAHLYPLTFRTGHEADGDEVLLPDRALLNPPPTPFLPCPYPSSIPYPSTPLGTRRTATRCVWCCTGRWRTRRARRCWRQRSERADGGEGQPKQRQQQRQAGRSGQALSQEGGRVDAQGGAGGNGVTARRRRKGGRAGGRSGGGEGEGGFSARGMQDGAGGNGSGVRGRGGSVASRRSRKSSRG